MRRQRVKGKSLCMTDFLANSEQMEHPELETTLTKPQKSPLNAADTVDLNKVAHSPLSDSPANYQDSLPSPASPARLGGTPDGVARAGVSSATVQQHT